MTGGAGFIGSNFVNHLFKQYPHYHVIVLDALTYAGNLDNILPEVKASPHFEFIQGNVCNGQLVTEIVKKVDIVVHYAAESHVARSIYDNAIFFQTDVMGTQVIANAVLKNKNIERFIHISSSEVYGTAEKIPMEENHPLNPKSPYAAAKSGADRLVYSYIKTYDIPAIIFRPFNNYGQNQHLEKAIPQFITSALQNQHLTLHGDGRATRDWLYVSDTALAVDKILHHDLDTIRGDVFNIGTGREISILEIAKLILKILNKDESLLTFVDNRPGQVERHCASVEKAKKTFNWKATTDFETGVAKTIEWYDKNRDWWEPQQWMKQYAMDVQVHATC